MLSELNNIKAVVLDFDCTITREHTGGRAAGPSFLEEEYIKNNTKNGFEEFVHGAIRRQWHIYIATYGDDSFAWNDEEVAGHALIERYMQYHFGGDQSVFRSPERDGEGTITKYHNVIAKFSGDRKAYHWSLIFEQLKNQVQAHEILFLDDDEGNIGYAQEVGCQTVVQGSKEHAALICANESVFELLNINL